MEKTVSYNEFMREVKKVKSRISNLIPDFLDMEISIRTYHKNGVIDTCISWGDSSNIDLSIRNENLKLIMDLLLLARMEAEDFKYNGYKVVKE